MRQEQWLVPISSNGRVVEDLRLNHNRAVAKAYVQTVADAVAAVAMVKEEQWSASSARTAKGCNDDEHRH